MTTFNRPFLKWAGGKSRLLPRIQKVLPEGNRLIEPFVGSGAVFLNMDYDSYLLADINPDLINLYQLLKQQKNSFIDLCSELFVDKNNNKNTYYELRQLFNETEAGESRAALFLYLNRHCFNGLCRYNLKGGFNVPFGQFKRPYFPAKEMEFFITRAERATFICDDFRKVLVRARAGNVVYCDPPYVPISTTANFTRYAQKDFSPACQEDLAIAANKLVARKVNVIISNHDNPITRKLYNGASISSFTVQRNISCKGAKREKAKEIFACFYPE